jgi:putative DNA primase/helicase
MLTGGDEIAARFMRQNFFRFKPEFKLLIAGNTKPSFSRVDAAMRRRFHLIPFTVEITNRDVNLPTKLQGERPGILKWMIEGLLEWRNHGLNPPPMVIEATTEYMAEEDVLGRWIEESCELTGDETSANLFCSWERWCDKNREKAGTMTKFIQGLKARSGITEKRIGHSSARGLKGIRLKEPCTLNPPI